VLIPPSCRQRITNVGQGDLNFLAICTPGFRPEAYEDIDSNPLPRDGISQRRLASDGEQRPLVGE
jgi:hypothetical protein